MGEDTVADLRLALELLHKHKDRVLIEERAAHMSGGTKFVLVQARVYGANTDDPGLVLNIKRWTDVE
jgi:hypothetical protein